MVGVVAVRRNTTHRLHRGVPDTEPWPISLRERGPEEGVALPYLDFQDSADNDNEAVCSTDRSGDRGCV